MNKKLTPEMIQSELMRIELKNIKEKNLVTALKLNIITWFEFFELFRALSVMALMISLMGCAILQEDPHFTLNPPEGRDQAQVDQETRSCKLDAYKYRNDTQQKAFVLCMQGAGYTLTKDDDQ